MKKINLYFFAFIFFSLTIVSAQTTQLGYNLATGMNQLIDVVESLLGPLFYFLLGPTTGGFFLFEKILFFLIVLSVVYVSLSTIGPFKENDKKVVKWIVVLAVSILSVRFLNDFQIIQSILLPYSVIGVALTSIIPFLIYFWFVQSFKDNQTLRKILWVFYIVVFMAIWSNRYEELGKISWFYFWSAIAAGLFLLFDGTIRRIIVKAEMEAVNANNREDYMIKLRKELKELRENKDLMRESHFKARERELQNKLNRAQKI